MLNWLKKHFIPHEGNDHQPHFLRTKNIRFLVLFVFLLELGIYVVPYIPVLSPIDNNYLAAVLPAVLDDLSNQNRQANNLNVLTVNPLLNRAAELKAQDMAQKGYFAHISPDGKAPWYWFNLVGYKYEYAGENLAVDFTDSKDVTLAWMNSPTHRANIMKNAYTEMGTGIASGVYEGNQTFFVVQVYGKPQTITTTTTQEPTKIVTSATTPNISTTTKVLGASEQIAQVVPPPVVQVVQALQAPVVVDTTPVPIYTKTNIFLQYLTAPRHIVNFILLLLCLLVLIALIFKIFIRMDKKHPILITNGMFVIILIFGVYSVNNYMARSKMNSNITFVSFSADSPAISN